MKRPAQILLGLLTLLPPAFFVLLIIKMVRIFQSVTSGRAIDQDFVMAQMHSMMIPGLITTLVSFLVMAIYLIDVNKNEEVDKNSRMLWMILFIAAGFITMPVYYVLYIHPWKHARPAADA